MKLPFAILMSAASGTIACSHDSRPADPHAPSTSAMQTALVSTAQPAEPGTPNIPTNGPRVAAPIPPVAAAPEDVSLTPSVGAGAARDVAPSSVPLDPALDKAETHDEQESVREIRALLAADKSLSSTARKVTITARKGRIRLSGQVNTPEERAAIERAARQAVNVIDVRNDLVVLK